MSAIDIIKRRLKEDRVPDVPDPDEIGEKKKRPREVAFMDVNLCFPCGKCPEFCPVQCIEYLADGSLPGRGVQPVQDRFDDWVRRTADDLLRRYHHQIGDTVRENLEALDPGAFVLRIEERVSADLQFIRLNGAVVGGLVGVALAIAHWLTG